MHEQQDHQEAALASELERLKLEKLREDKMRQQIRQTRLFPALSLFKCRPSVLTEARSRPVHAAGRLPCQ